MVLPPKHALVVQFYTLDLCFKKWLASLYCGSQLAVYREILHLVDTHRTCFTKGSEICLDTSSIVRSGPEWTAGCHVLLKTLLCTDPVQCYFAEVCCFLAKWQDHDLQHRLRWVGGSAAVQQREHSLGVPGWGSGQWQQLRQAVREIQDKGSCRYSIYKTNPLLQRCQGQPIQMRESGDYWEYALLFPLTANIDAKKMFQTHSHVFSFAVYWQVYMKHYICRQSNFYWYAD